MTEQQSAILVMILTVLFQSGVLTGLAVLARKALAERLGPQRAGLAAQIAAQAVRAVEQVAARNGWNSTTKLNEALAWARELAAQHGVALDDQQWRILIEAAVHDLNTAWTTLEAEAATAAPPISIAQPGNSAQGVIIGAGGTIAPTSG